jgi:aryl-alcohol dehydrogenase-like predicted oxidoreductase
VSDHRDLHYFHRCDFGPEDRYLDDALATMLRLREEGKFRFLGLSDWDLGEVRRFADRVDPDVVQPYRNVRDDAWESSGLRAWVEKNDAGVAFFSPLKHGLLLGKYESPPRFEPGDMRGRIPEFGDPEVIRQLRACRDRVTERFSAHPEPVLHALTGALLSNAPTGCVLLGLRNPSQVEAAATLGDALEEDDRAWVAELYDPSGFGGV